MATWEALEAIVERAVGHFGAVASIDAPDAYVTGMALRHVLQCGTREMSDALSMLSRAHPKGAGFSLLSDDSRRAYLAVRRLEGEEMLSPSDIDPRILEDARAAAMLLAESLRADVKRIRSDLSISSE